MKGGGPPLLRRAAPSALLLPEGIARRVDAHHDSARIEELRLGASSRILARSCASVFAIASPPPRLGR